VTGLWFGEGKEEKHEGKIENHTPKKAHKQEQQTTTTTTTTATKKHQAAL
jgi:hypothetical protein